MAFDYQKYYDTLFHRRGYHKIDGEWYYDATGKFRVYSTAS